MTTGKTDETVYDDGGLMRLYMMIGGLMRLYR